MTFNPPESSKVLESVVQKFEEYCIGQTNETFEPYLFNSRLQKEDESIDHYVSALANHDRVIFVNVYMIHVYVIELCLASKSLPCERNCCKEDNLL